MMKTLKLACLSALALVAAGCGKKVAVPEKTIVAAYIDLQKAYENGTSFASTVVDALPSKGEGAEIKKKIEEKLKELDRYKDALSPEWVVITWGGDVKDINRGNDGNIAFAAKVAADDDAVKKLLKEYFEGENITTDKRNGRTIFEIDGEQRFCLIDGHYLVYGNSKDAFNDMFDLYAGKGRASEDFNDLADISGGTVCRISTAPVAGLLERFEVRRDIEKFGDASEDEDLANLILNLGPVSLDIGIGDELGLALQVACDSSDDAKTIENLMRGVAFLARVGCDAGAFGADNPETLRDMFSRGKVNVVKNAKDIFIDLAHDVEADRSGSVSTLSCKLKAERIADFCKHVFESDDKGNEGKPDDEWWKSSNSAAKVTWEAKKKEKAP